MQFPFQEIYKEYAKFSAQKMCLKGFSMQHQNMVWQDIRRWSKQNQNMGLWKHQKNMRSEALKIRRWYHAPEALQDQKIRRCTAPSCLTLMIFKRCIYKHQIRRKYRWQTTLTDKRNVRATKGNVSRHSVNKARGS